MDENNFEVQPSVSDNVQKPFFKKKVVIAILVVFLLLVVCFFVFDGQSWIKKIFVFKSGDVERENLVPNPSFEKGTGDMPAGWTTESERIVE